MKTLLAALARLAAALRLPPDLATLRLAPVPVPIPVRVSVRGRARR
jgi:hypothetical protein